MRTKNNEKEFSWFLEGSVSSHIERYSSGKLKSLHHQHRGKLHGRSTFYAETGQILSMSIYINGKKSKMSLSYYASGPLYSCEWWDDGVLDGKQLYFYPDGTLKSELFYQKGKQVGISQTYYEKGQVKRRMEYCEEPQCWRHTIFDPCGNTLEVY